LTKKEYTMNEIVQVLIDNGYETMGWKGSHLRLKRGHVIIHVSRNVRLNLHYTHSILKKAGIEKEVLDE